MDWNLKQLYRVIYVYFSNIIITKDSQYSILPWLTSILKSSWSTNRFPIWVLIEVCNSIDNQSLLQDRNFKLSVKP